MRSAVGPPRDRQGRRQNSVRAMAGTAKIQDIAPFGTPRPCSSKYARATAASLCPPSAARLRRVRRAHVSEARQSNSAAGTARLVTAAGRGLRVCPRTSRATRRRRAPLERTPSLPARTRPPGPPLGRPSIAQRLAREGRNMREAAVSRLRGGWNVNHNDVAARDPRPPAPA